MNDEEEWEKKFRLEWTREVQKLLALTQMGPFRVVVTEVNAAVDTILKKHFKDPRARTIKSLVLVYMVGQVLEEWVKPKGAPLAAVYRRLLEVTAHESALGQLVLQHAAAEGMDYTNSMVNTVINKYRRHLHIVRTPPQPPSEG